MQGTTWETENFCNGDTVFTLYEGRLKIADKGKKKKVILKPEPNGNPGVYVAKAE